MEIIAEWRMGKRVPDRMRWMIFSISARVQLSLSGPRFAEEYVRGYPRSINVGLKSGLGMCMSGSGLSSWSGSGLGSGLGFLFDRGVGGSGLGVKLEWGNCGLGSKSVSWCS